MRIKPRPLGRPPGRSAKSAITTGRKPRRPVRDVALRSGRHSDPEIGALMPVSVDQKTFSGDAIAPKHSMLPGERVRRGVCVIHALDP
jgi:hypothetical protein